MYNGLSLRQDGKDRESAAERRSERLLEVQERREARLETRAVQMFPGLPTAQAVAALQTQRSTRTAVEAFIRENWIIVAAVGAGLFLMLFAGGGGGRR